MDDKKMSSHTPSTKSICKEKIDYIMCILFACTGSIKLVAALFLVQSNVVVGSLFIGFAIFSYCMSVAFFLIYEGVIE